MKKFSLLALAAAGLLFGACSEKDVVEESGGSAFNSNGDAYVGISISLPSSQSTTRANDDLTNGDAAEFLVHNAYLYLFKGTSEANAKFIKRYSLTNDFKNDTQGEGGAEHQSGVSPTSGPESTTVTGTSITSTSVSVCKITKPDLKENDELFAYVVVNAQGDLATEPAVDTPYSTFATQNLNAADNGGTLEGAIGSNGLLMTNSPISDKGAGSSAPTGETITTLVKLVKENIKNTQDEAIASPAGCIYVERAAAKVTLIVNSEIVTSLTNVTTNETSPAAITFDKSTIKWMVINTEPKFYNARQVESAWNGLVSQYATAATVANTKYRFITKYNFAPTRPANANHLNSGDEFFRTYFAKDLQYDSEANLDFKVAGTPGILADGETEVTRNWLSLDSKAYVPENTFDVNNQYRHNTTQVTIQVKFNGGNDFFTLADDAHFYAAADMENIIAGRVQELFGFNTALNKVKDAILTKVKNNNSGKFFKITVSPKVTVSKDAAKDKLPYSVDYEVTLTQSDSEEGTYTAYTMTESDKLTTEEETTAGWTDVKESAEAALTISLYKGGLSYYNIRIQHFGEYETPWSATRATQPGTTIEQIYGSESTRTADYLGRYGVVRDNWYNLSIDEIKKLGTAEPKPVNGDTTPDDDIEETFYISAHVHILPWVLRTQSVKF